MKTIGDFTFFFFLKSYVSVQVNYMGSFLIGIMQGITRA